MKPTENRTETRNDAWLQLVAEWLIAEARWKSATPGGQFWIEECYAAEDKLKKERKTAEWLLAEARDQVIKLDDGWSDTITMLGREEQFADGLRAEVERLKAGSQSGSFDGLTPEALRSAADVVQLCWIKMFGSSDRIPTILRAEADRMEKAHAEAEATARRRTARAVKAYDVWKAPVSLPWDELTPDRQGVWLAVVDALEDGAA